MDLKDIFFTKERLAVMESDCNHSYRSGFYANTRGYFLISKEWLEPYVYYLKHRTFLNSSPPHKIRLLTIVRKVKKAQSRTCKPEPTMSLAEVLQHIGTSKSESDKSEGDNQELELKIQEASEKIDEVITIEAAANQCSVSPVELNKELDQGIPKHQSPRKNSGRKMAKGKRASSELKSSIPVCIFCLQPKGDEVRLGSFHQMSKVTAHHFCLLFSCALEQNGEDDEGILGFLQKDILKEVQRGSKLKCIHCGKYGATVGCNTKCKKAYHFPCGLENNALFKFCDDFSSYCEKHRKFQKEDTSNINTDCPICLEPVAPDPKKSIYPPCCKKTTWFHKMCLQKLALSAGYFFKCPLCNDKTKFVKSMMEMGLYVPEQDASWEKEPDAFQELLERPVHCDAEKCECPKGREFSEDDTSWEILLCNHCGATGNHCHCAGLPKNSEIWDCPQCSEIIVKVRSFKRKRTFSSSDSSPSKKVAMEDEAGPSRVVAPGTVSKYTRLNVEHIKPLSPDPDVPSTKAFKYILQCSHLEIIQEMATRLSGYPRGKLLSRLNAKLASVGESEDFPTEYIVSNFISMSLSYQKMCLLYQIFNCFFEMISNGRRNSNSRSRKKNPRRAERQMFLEVCFKNAILHAHEQNCFEEISMTDESDENVNDEIRDECRFCGRLLQPGIDAFTIDLSTGTLNVMCSVCCKPNITPGAFPVGANKPSEETVDEKSDEEPQKATSVNEEPASSESLTGSQEFEGFQPEYLEFSSTSECRIEDMVTDHVLKDSSQTFAEFIGKYVEIASEDVSASANPGFSSTQSGSHSNQSGQAPYATKKGLSLSSCPGQPEMDDPSGIESNPFDVHDTFPGKNINIFEMSGRNIPDENSNGHWSDETEILEDPHDVPDLFCEGENDSLKSKDSDEQINTGGSSSSSCHNPRSSSQKQMMKGPQGLEEQQKSPILYNLLDCKPEDCEVEFQEISSANSSGIAIEVVVLDDD